MGMKKAVMNQSRRWSCLRRARGGHGLDLDFIGPTVHRSIIDDETKPQLGLGCGRCQLEAGIYASGVAQADGRSGDLRPDIRKVIGVWIVAGTAVQHEASR